MSTYYDRGVSYARRVVAREEVAGKLEILACERFLRDLERQGSDGFPYRLDIELGARACAFIELCPHIKGAWAKPVLVDGRLKYATIKLEDWQIFADLQLFGWVHVDTGLRRFRRAYEEVARKNAKSTRAAARQLYMLTADGEPGAHCYSAATTGEQAREVFDTARNMAMRVPEFLARFGVTVGKHDITVAQTASSFKPLNAEGSTLDGLNVHGGVVDEVHAHKRRDLWDVLDTATGARQQALLSAITTAGVDLAGIGYELRTYTVNVLQGVIVDETWFGVIYTLDNEDLIAGPEGTPGWQKPEVWRKANPNLGVSVYVEEMQSSCLRAQGNPSAQANFLTKRLNVWLRSDRAWMDMVAWDRCARHGLTVHDVRHLPCVGGLDLASKVDIAAKVLLFRDDARGKWILIPTFWLPERAVQLGANAQYDGWLRAGWLRVTDGEVTDFDVIEDAIRHDKTTLSLGDVGADPWQATQLISHLLDDGVQMVEVRQTVQSLSEPMKTLEALVLTGELEHDGNPVMTWMIKNVVCHTDAKDNIYPRKERDANKIDGAVAAIIALNRAMARQAASIDAWLNDPVIA